MNPKNLLLFSLLIFASQLMSAQKANNRYSRIQKANEQFEVLETGFLIIALPSKQKKITAIESLLEEDEMSEKSRKVMEKRLEQARQEQQDQGIQIQSAIRSNYTLGASLFIFQHHIDELLALNRDGIFLDESLKPDFGINLDDKAFLLLKFGPVGASKMDAIYLVNQDLELIPSPFPSPIRFNSLGYMMDRVFASSGAFEENLERVIKRLNKKLLRFKKNYGGELIAYPENPG